MLRSQQLRLGAIVGLFMCGALHAECVFKSAMTDAEIEACKASPTSEPAVKKASQPKRPSVPVFTGNAYNPALYSPKKNDIPQIDPAIGLTIEAARMGLQSWCGFGSTSGPATRNRTQTARGVREQWVCGGHRYVYFENGILTAFQD